MLHWILRIQYGLGGVRVTSGFHYVVSEHMVEMKCSNAKLLLSFPEMRQESSDADAHSAGILQFEAVGKASQIEELSWGFSDCSPWSPGRLRPCCKLWDK